MYNVQKDLAALRQKVLEAEMALQKNEKVQKLEEDCEWCVCARIVAKYSRGLGLSRRFTYYVGVLCIRYRSEAIRLDGFATAMKKDLKYMKDKLEVLGKATPIAGPQKDMHLIQKMMHVICTSTQTI